jgi:hypothetical protein
MPSVTFITNDSEIQRLEGLYIKEINPPAQVVGVFLGVVGIVGETVRGPVDVPVEITTEADFKAIFGGRDYGSGGTLINKVWQSLLNKPFGKTVIVRAAAAAAAVASSHVIQTGPTDIIKIAATSPGFWGNNVTYDVQNPSDADSNHFKLVITYLGTTYTYDNLDVHATGVDNLATTIGSDLSNVVVVTKLANGRPTNIASQTLGTSGTSPVAGSDGSIADSDFTASNRGINQIINYKGVGVVFTAERNTTSVKAALATAAAASSDRLFLIGAADETTSKSTATTDVASYIGDRMVYCFNSALTLDPETGTSIWTSPTSWMASILSQIDADIHPGEEDTKAFTAGIQKLYNENYARADYIDFKAAGICALEKDDGFAFVSGVTTNNVPGKQEITRRRSADFIQLSVADELKHSVKKKNVKSRRDSNLAILSAFLTDLADAERIVDKLDDGTPAFSLNSASVNTTAQRALGIEKILMQVKLIDHMLEIVLETEIGNGITIVQTQ